MKSFNEYLEEKREEKEEKYEPIKTVFGCHSSPTPPKHCPAQLLHPDADVFQEPVGGGYAPPIQEKLNRHFDINAEHHEMALHHPHDEDHKEAIQKYTASSHYLNKHLHKSAAAGEDPHGSQHWPSEHSKDIHAMDRVVHAHKTHKPFNVYTGVHREHDLHKIGHDQGATEKKPIKVQHHAYLSTSIDKEVAKGFGHHHTETSHIDKEGITHITRHVHLMKIHVPKGHHGAYVGHSSVHPNEKEFILPRGTKLHIHHTPKTEIEHGKVYNFGDGYKEKTHYHYHTWSARIHKDKE